jgi:hypothetical protein
LFLKAATFHWRLGKKEKENTTINLCYINFAC